MKNKIQQKIYAIFQTLKAYASKLRISSFVGGQFKKRQERSENTIEKKFKLVDYGNTTIDYYISKESLLNQFMDMTDFEIAQEIEEYREERKRLFE
jgi:hypothetical protein